MNLGTVIGLKVHTQKHLVEKQGNKCEGTLDQLTHHNEMWLFNVSLQQILQYFPRAIK